MITFSESVSYHNLGEPKSFNWLELYDQSEIIKMLMTAGGLYKKSNIQENLVIASHPPAKDRCKDGKKPPLSRVLVIMLLSLGAETPEWATNALMKYPST